MDERGPFDRILQPEPAERNDRAAKIVVGVSIVLGLFLLILVLPPISVFDDEDGGVTGPVTAELRDELPPPPAGFEAVSELLDLSAPGGSGPAQGEERPRLTLDLTTPVADGETLVFFTFIDEEWRRLADATAVAGGGAAQGEVPFIPSNVAVFRPTGQAAQEVPDEPGTAEAVTSRVVLGSLPPGTQPDPRAIETLTTLNPAGLTPLADGQIAGLPLELPEGLNVPVAPTVSAFTPEEIDALNGILASPELRTAHVQALLALVGENDYAGVDLDYRTIDAARSADFVAFVTELSDGLQAVGRTLTITLPA
ncbi:MAG: hypothetical protein U1B78_04230, partial [Dehalococcoidia bacterium]|nr:hypothetical protein [Dehalococcoidia bacterium]